MLLRELVPGGGRPRSAIEDFWALQELDFGVDRGETIAIVGRNGSGKSTLLSLVAGAVRPSAGCVSVRGRVAPILALGVGFEQDMSAVENAYLNASLLGVDEEEVDRVLPDILDFAELGNLLDTPVRHFSSGMLARLGFAIAMHVEREILLVDEVLAVGDQAFQSKCIDRVRTLQRQGLTLLFATHDMHMARMMCDRVIWLEGGRIEADGPIGEHLPRYEGQQE